MHDIRHPTGETRSERKRGGVRHVGDQQRPA